MNYGQIKTEAKNAIKGNWFMLFLTILIVMVATGSGIATILAPVLFGGLYLVIRKLMREKKVDFVLTFDFLKDLNHALKLFGVGLIYYLLVTIGFVLFIVPGIIFALQYSQALYIMAENKDMDIFEALRKSQDLMRGYKWDMFVFEFSFIGHYLLCLISIGIYAIWFLPYYYTAKVNYYVHLTKQNVQEVLTK